MATKLIEVAMPLTQVNEACVAEKNLRVATPANLHMWWARRPLAACRAVLFAQLVDDPSAHPDRFPSREAQAVERERLFAIMRRLMEPSGPSEDVVAVAREEIRLSVGTHLTVVDPFAGGGAIPIEAQRLGLSVGASDLNPVAVLLNRVVLDQLQIAMHRPATNPGGRRLPGVRQATGFAGLAEDLIWYGEWLRAKAEGDLSHLYPQVRDVDGTSRTPIAWIWARAVPCPNPACRIEAPLVRSFQIAKKAGREVWLDPVTEGPANEVRYEIRAGKTPRIAGTVGRRGATCVACGSAIPLTYIREQGRAGRITYHMMVVAALGDRRRLYFSATDDQVAATRVECPDPFGTELALNPRDVKVRNYGMTTQASLFTPRQLTALTHLVSLLPEMRLQILQHAGNDGEYADLLVTLMALSLSRMADLGNSLTTWKLDRECPVHLFTKQAIPMAWDFAETNPFCSSAGSLTSAVLNTARALEGPLVEYPRSGTVSVSQANAATRSYPDDVVVCTDPPYFDNIGYADLADFFYVWLRLALKNVHPDLFSTLLTPKAEELVATPYRFENSQQAANDHFESGFRQVFAHVKAKHHPEVPMTVFYAYKQEDEESDDDTGGSGAGATGWEKLLQGMVDTGLQVTATWPIRTEMATRMIGRGSNALASSVVLACRPRAVDAGVTDRQGFVRQLRRVLGEKLVELQSGGVQPVDMAQASIGPGMAVFTSYVKVLDGGDHAMSVGTALQIINQVLDELQTEQESEFDSDTRWAVSWFEQFGMNAGEFGDALSLATARGTAMNALERAGIVESRAGRVRLLDRGEYPAEWDPTTDKRLTVWEVCQHLIRRVDGDGGLAAAAGLIRQVGGLADAARDLAYRLYEIANRKGWVEEARAYNNLAAEWRDLVALAAQAPSNSSTLF